MHCEDLGESFPTSISLQKFVSIQQRTSHVKFEWFGPSPTEPFNSGDDKGKGKGGKGKGGDPGEKPDGCKSLMVRNKEANKLFVLENEHFHDQQVPWPLSSNTFFWKFEYDLHSNSHSLQLGEDYSDWARKHFLPFNWNYIL